MNPGGVPEGKPSVDHTCRPALLDLLRAGADFEPLVLRPLAASEWSKAIQQGNDDRQNCDMPGYFADRLGYRLHLSQLGLHTGSLFNDLPPFRHSSAEYEGNLAKWLRSHDAVGEIFPGDIRRPIEPSQFLRQLLEQWREHLVSYGIEPDQGFELDGEFILLDVYKRSVYFPGPPAIPGPGFLSWLGPSQVAELSREVGPEGLRDFALALSIIHEESHFLQTGESLLCEFTWAALWTAFLDTADLWRFQRDILTGRSCNLEEPYLRTARVEPSNWGTLFGDTYSGTIRLFGRDDDWYGLICALAYLADVGRIDYLAYLSLLAQVFAQGDSYKAAAGTVLAAVG